MENTEIKIEVKEENEVKEKRDSSDFGIWERMNAAGFNPGQYEDFEFALNGR